MRGGEERGKGEGEGGKLHARATSVEKVVFHARTQLRLARSHARPNRIRCSVWGKPEGATLPQSSDMYIHMCIYVWICRLIETKKCIHIYIYIYTGQSISDI